MNKERKERAQIIPFTQNGEYFFQRALSYYHQNHLFKAKKYLLRAVKLDDKEPVYIGQLAAVLSELGEYTESNKWLYYLLSEVDPSAAECYFFLANNYVHLGLFEKAEDEALYYLELEPHGEFAQDAEELLAFIGSEALHELGENVIIRKHSQAKEKMEAGEFQHAISLFQEMINEHPSFWAAYNNLALAYFYSGKKEKAVSTLEEVLTKNPGNLHALCNLALFLYFIGFHRQSEQIKHKLKTVYPIHHDQRYKLGSTFALLREHEYAFKWLSSVRQTTLVEEIPFYHWLAVSAFMTGREKTAKTSWEHIKKIDPESEVAPHYLAELKKGTLTPDAVDYHYRLPEKDKTYFNFLTEGLKDNEKTKLVHLYILRKNFHKEGYESLQSFCKSEKEPLYLKELASGVMLNQVPGKPVVIKHEGLEMIYKADTELPATITTGLKVIAKLQESLKPGELNDVIYRLWANLFKYACLHNMPFENSDGWSAAIEYSWKKQKGSKVAQKEIASFYNISVATVSKYAKKIKHFLRKQQL
ncbi:hypothetical protein DCC39_05045 [Pueribacillus theae]|uniref:Uncharacterized protein n=1 Tax=Pueribacillus theae TaxID=2171751 RepID=A0A2U1K5E3_9BACI|nr:tetratricopeptide repeat protein [Pueribacillus theae]PWA12592.1 hypothetical protein DCC39_05045 [Pueribacillus theae]